MIDRWNNAKWAACGAVMTIVILSVGKLVLYPSLRCEVRNGGQVPIRNLTLEVHGSLGLFPVIAPGETVRCRLSPAIESDVSLEFSRHPGVIERGRVDVYLTSGSRGDLSIDVGMSNSASWRVSVSSDPFGKVVVRTGSVALVSYHLRPGRE